MYQICQIFKKVLPQMYQIAAPKLSLFMILLSLLESLEKAERQARRVNEHFPLDTQQYGKHAYEHKWFEGACVDYRHLCPRRV